LECWNCGFDSKRTISWLRGDLQRFTCYCR